MTIRPNAWHLQVFLQAFVHDRYWLDNGFFAELSEVEQKTEEMAKLPEIVAYKEFRDQLEKTDPRERDYGRLRELRMAGCKAQEEWRKPQEANYTAKRSREISERLYSDRMSLCPYFWSVVVALVFYYGVVRSTRPIRNFFGRTSETFATALVTSLGLVVVAFIGFGIYESRDELPSISDVAHGVASIPSGIKNEIALEMRQSQLRKEFERAERERRIRWEQEHPVEARIQREDIDRPGRSST